MTSMSTVPWLVRSKAQPRLRLFCFPYAGGGASIYRQWFNKLPRDIEVCAIQLPGRENRIQEPPFTQLSPLVKTLRQVLAPYLDLPFAFFGYSMGAHISFELARLLRRQQQPGPAHLFIAAAHAPQLPHRDEAIHDLAEPEFLAKLASLGGTPEAVLQNAELMELLSPTLRADFKLYETHAYIAETPLDCPITAFGGEQDATVSRQELMAWNEQTTKAFKLYIFPGDHFFLHGEQERLLQATTQALLTLN
ncbi:thioesterase [Ktedonosporobacter rubrisoli]|uniref:Thioesterase n=1 Tax=Ktedonosporobacter rubrisoli TaxID=2509675 RepID=A0A4V0YZ80_KTERU|nr:alpha/beta fold hydrolase [Ktedonosporobacter rubrisoli]QBD78791.1 thioesterase [Ktedonosporobacter rubrisoli]